MTDLRKAAEMALEALEGALSDDQPYIEKSKKAAIALRQALAQPEQGPVAWMYTSHWKGDERFITRYQSELTAYKADKVWPLYTTPPQRTWVSLTDAEMCECYNSPNVGYAVEAKLKEKNT